MFAVLVELASALEGKHERRMFMASNAKLIWPDIFVAAGEGGCFHQRFFCISLSWAVARFVCGIKDRLRVANNLCSFWILSLNPGGKNWVYGSTFNEMAGWNAKNGRTLKWNIVVLGCCRVSHDTEGNLILRTGIVFLKEVKGINQMCGKESQLIRQAKAISCVAVAFCNRIVRCR